MKNKIIRFDEVGSTNDSILQNIDAYHDRTMIVARLQTAGKGRRGNKWCSPAGVNFSGSYLMKNVDFPSQKASWVGGLAALNAIREILKSEENLWVKWPNDVYCGTKKIAGILSEVTDGDNGKKHVVIGIGINVNMNEPDIESYGLNATSIYLEGGNKVDLAEFDQILYSKLNTISDIVKISGIDALSRIWKSVNLLIGGIVDVGVDDDKKINGKVLDIGDNGELVLVESGGDVHRLFAGDVTIQKFTRNGRL